jgi:hypothetical protein
MKEIFPVRAVLAGVVALVLAASLGVVPAAASSTRSASGSSFCTTLTTASSTKAPAANNLASYKKWLASYLPEFEKLASEAPNASSKTALNQLVTIMKAEETSTTLAKLDAAVAVNSKKWTTDWEALVKALLSCVPTT